MHLYIDASRANAKEPTGVEEYAFHVIEELKKIVPPEWRVTLFSREPLAGQLSHLPPNWQSRVLSWPPRRLWTQIRLSAAMLKIKLRTTHYALRTILFVPAHVVPLIHLPRAVVTIHDVGALRFPHTYSGFEQWYIKWSTAFVLRRRAHILVPSEFTKREIVSLFCHPERSPDARGGAKSKDLPAGPQKGGSLDSLRSLGMTKYESYASRIHVVPLAYDTARYHAHLDPAKIEQVIAKYGITKPYFYFQGRIEEKKNVARLVEAFGKQRGRASVATEARPRQVSLVLAGKPGYGFKTVKSAIEASPVKDRIHLLGYIPPEHAPHLMAGASAFVFPSLYEGFGIPLLEAMAVGTPVVAARAGSLPEVAGDAALYFDPQNIVDMTSALTRIVSDQPVRDALRARGFERVRSFLWKKTAEDTCRVLTAIGK